MKIIINKTISDGIKPYKAGGIGNSLHSRIVRNRWANEILKDLKYQNNEVGILVWA